MKNTATVVGAGLLAQEFKSKLFSKDLLILASGVSNSQETREPEFTREFDLVKSEIQKNSGSTVIYFSTCSIGITDETPYIKHKLNVERYISESCDEYYIFRLPQVVGFVKNTTLISYFIRSIINNKKISIQRYAYRDLIDISDISRIVKLLVDKKVGINSIINIATGRSINVLDIFQYLLKETGYNSDYIVCDTGVEQKIDSSFLRDNLKSDYIFHENYWRLVLNKYLPLYLQE